jgi:hypothetical protein
MQKRTISYPSSRIHYQISAMSANKVSHINFQSIPVSAIESLPLQIFHVKNLRVKTFCDIFLSKSELLGCLTCGDALTNQNVAPEKWAMCQAVNYVRKTREKSDLPCWLEKV